MSVNKFTMSATTAVAVAVADLKPITFSQHALSDTITEYVSNMTWWQFVTAVTAVTVVQHQQHQQHQHQQLPPAPPPQQSLKDNNTLKVFVDLLASIAFPFYFECPAVYPRDIVDSNSQVEFKFSITKVTSGMDKQVANASAFHEHMRDKQAYKCIQNLARDATLFIPTTYGQVLAHDQAANYANIYSYLQTATNPVPYFHHLFAAVKYFCVRGLEVSPQSAAEVPLWLSTHGQGVPWLHFRFDVHPKYYSNKLYVQ